MKRDEDVKTHLRTLANGTSSELPPKPIRVAGYYFTAVLTGMVLATLLIATGLVAIGVIRRLMEWAL